MVKFNEKALIERIIELRKANYGQRGMSKFAAELGISPSTYFYYEQNRVPPIDLLLKICELCGELMMQGTKTIPERCSNKACPNHNPHKKK